MNNIPTDPLAYASTAGLLACSELVTKVLAFIAQDGCTDDAFDSLAAELFAHQYGNNPAYRRFCQRRGATPRSVRHWHDIPAVPIDAFKELDLQCMPSTPTDRVFMTSGTTRSEVKGRHRHPTLAVYDMSMTRNFANRFMPGADKMPMGILFPTEIELPNSSLAHYLSLAMREFGTESSRYFMSQQGLDITGLCESLADAERNALPYALLGASYSFVHLLDELGFDAVDAGGIDESWRFERAKPAYCVSLDQAGLKAALAAAERTVELPAVERVRTLA